jgi:hypothetical protein
MLSDREGLNNMCEACSSNKEELGAIRAGSCGYAAGGGGGVVAAIRQ